MAIIRRVDVLGWADDSAGVGASSGAAAQVPRQAVAEETEARYPAGADSAPPGAAAWINDTEAAAVASKGAGLGTVLLAFVMVAAGAWVAYVLHRWGNKPEAFKIGNQTAAYAALVVFAAAVERFLEPFSNLLPGRRERNAYEQVVAALYNGHPAVSLRDAAAAKARLDRANAKRTLLMWALATLVATVAAGASGFYLLHMVAASDWVFTTVPGWADALVTGLVVGTGTKPLHDLIGKVKSSAG
jgi:hypothetical protein